MKKNINVLFTFADCQKPESLTSFQEAEILENDGVYFKFNNSALFVNDSKQQDKGFDSIFWEMGKKSLKSFSTIFME